ncbi:MAG: FGGY family carbohydrate kinase [Christensenellales bacterium]|jgi:glycerol kinase
MRNHILVIDEGTTGTRALIFDKDFNIVSVSYTEITQYTPAENRVEHDFDEIYEKSVDMCQKAMEKAKLTAEDIACIGVTNQRCTYALWNKHTGEVLGRGIVWQDTRAAHIVDAIDMNRYMTEVRTHIGTFPASCRIHIVLKWLMDNDPAAAEAIKSGDYIIGTIDTWLIWKLTGGKVHAISSSNATSAGAFDMKNNCWYAPLFKEYGVPMHVLPEVRDEDANYGETTVFGATIPITGAIADQQSSLFGQNCRVAGTAKCTNGTGTFMDINTGDAFNVPPMALDYMSAWTLSGKRMYVAEGMMAVTGSAVQWLRDGLGIITSSAETETLAASVQDTNGVYFCINLAGMSVPYYDPYSRGTIFGITRGTTKAHIVRATLEGIAFGLADIMEAIENGLNIKMKAIKIDGGASQNNVLAQMFADYIDCDIFRPDSAEATALGAAQVAALGAGLYTLENLPDPLKYDRVFKPAMDPAVRAANIKNHKKAVERQLGWLKD